MKKELIEVYFLDEKTKKELDIEEEKEYLLFEWDPDYMIYQKDWEVYDYVHFTEYNNQIIYDWDSQYLDKLEEFFNNDEKWQLFEEQTRDAFKAYDWLKIAYRGGRWYVYTLYFYNWI